MALERRIDTDVWDDTWFSELSVDGKLLFLFLLTNRRTSSCGAYEVSIRQMAFETGIDAGRVSELLTSFGERIQWWPQHQIVFVRNFYRRQKPNPSYETNARKAAAELPADVRDTVYAAYPTLRSADDTLSSIETPSDDTLTTPSPQPVDRVSPVLELELVRDLEPEREPEEMAERPRVVVSDTPFAVYSAFLEESADPDFKPAPKWKDKQIGIATRLLEQGYGDDKVRRCVRYMKSQAWRTSPWDLGTVEKFIGTWEASGMPEYDQPKSIGRRSKNEPDFSGIDTFTDAWKQAEARR